MKKTLKDMLRLYPNAKEVKEYVYAESHIQIADDEFNRCLDNVRDITAKLEILKKEELTLLNYLTGAQEVVAFADRQLNEKTEQLKLFMKKMETNEAEQNEELQTRTGCSSCGVGVVDGWNDHADWCKESNGDEDCGHTVFTPGCYCSQEEPEEKTTYPAYKCTCVSNYYHSDGCAYAGKNIPVYCDCPGDHGEDCLLTTRVYPEDMRFWIKEAAAKKPSIKLCHCIDLATMGHTFFCPLG